MVHMTLEEIEKTKKEHLTVEEVSSVLGISSHAFYKYYGSFPFPILKIGKRYIILKKPFVDYLRTGVTADLDENNGENADIRE